LSCPEPPLYHLFTGKKVETIRILGVEARVYDEYCHHSTISEICAEVEQEFYRS
jgi:hypothetical protein